MFVLIKIRKGCIIRCLLFKIYACSTDQPSVAQQLTRSRGSEKGAEGSFSAFRVLVVIISPVRINADDQKKWKIAVYSLTFVAALILLSLVSALARK